MNLEDNKQVVAQWFDSTWWENYDPEIIKKFADEKIVMQYPIHGKHKWSGAIITMIDRLRSAFPDLKFWVNWDLVAEWNYVVGRWEWGWIHTWWDFSDLPAGKLKANSGKKLYFTGMTVFKLKNWKVLEEIWEEDALKAGLQLDIIKVNN